MPLPGTYPAPICHTALEQRKSEGFCAEEFFLRQEKISI
jgi:hypothetical protein